jgi:putative phosphoribosyl transferase
MNDFPDRAEAGRQLAQKLSKMTFDRPIVLALPRGGVPVAVEVAAALDAPLDLLFVRKIGFPGHEEFAIAAVVDGKNPQIVRNQELLDRYPVDEGYITRERDRELAEIERRRKQYTGGGPPQDVADRTVLVVDDGVATGTTVRAALAALKRSGAERIILAVPVISPDTAAGFRREGFEVIAVIEPEDFRAVGMFYRDFHQLDDDEVVNLLQLAAAVT